MPLTGAIAAGLGGSLTLAIVAAYAAFTYTNLADTEINREVEAILANNDTPISVNWETRPFMSTRARELAIVARKKFPLIHTAAARGKAYTATYATAFTYLVEWCEDQKASEAERLRLLRVRPNPKYDMKRLARIDELADAVADCWYHTARNQDVLHLVNEALLLAFSPTQHDIQFSRYGATNAMTKQDQLQEHGSDSYWFKGIRNSKFFRWVRGENQARRMTVAS